MRDPYLYPRLRWPIELQLQKIEGQEVLCLSCPLGVAPAPLILVAAVAPILSCFDGNTARQEIADRFAQYGVQLQMIEQLVTLLDEHLYLESPRFYAAERDLRENYGRATVREAALAGSGYSPERSELEHEVLSCLERGRSARIQAQAPEGKLAALIAPHVDYRRGSLCYGITYSHLPERAHDLLILLGTGHQYSKQLFHLTSKDFNTPLGMLRCDQAFVSALCDLYGADRALADEFLHRREHSIELQTPFLRQLSPEASIVPILTGSFHEMFLSGRRPEETEQYESFAAALAECLRKELSAGRRVCLVAGVDMAHVGRRFGDSGQLSPEYMEQIAVRDHLYLKAIENLDTRQLFEHVAEDGDARRLCGFPAVFTLIDALKRCGGRFCARIFDYRQAVDYNTDCAVTFAGAGIYTVRK